MLSPSTAVLRPRLKFARLHSDPFMREYVSIASDAFQRRGLQPSTGRPMVARARPCSLEEVVGSSPSGAGLELADIYEKVEFSDPDPGVGQMRLSTLVTRPYPYTPRSERQPARHLCFHALKGWSVVRYVHTAPRSAMSSPAVFDAPRDFLRQRRLELPEPLVAPSAGTRDADRARSTTPTGSRTGTLLPAPGSRPTDRRSSGA